MFGLSAFAGSFRGPIGSGMVRSSPGPVVPSKVGEGPGLPSWLTLVPSSVHMRWCKNPSDSTFPYATCGRANTIIFSGVSPVGRRPFSALGPLLRGSFGLPNLGFPQEAGG